MNDFFVFLLIVAVVATPFVVYAVLWFVDFAMSVVWGN